MAKNPLNDPKLKPDEELLEKLFSNSYSAYLEILEAAENFTQEWNYAKYNGWTQKIADKKKVLLYILPAEGSFDISMALRDQEKAELLKNSALKFAAKKLEGAKQYREGFAVRFTVQEENRTGILAFVKELVKMR